MSDKPRVFVSRVIPDVGLDRLREHCDVEVWPKPTPPRRDTLLDKVRGCHGLVTMLSDKIDESVLNTAGDGLKVVANYAVGYNNIDVAACRERGVAVGNTPDVLTDATADVAALLMLAAARCVTPAAASVRDGGWKTWAPMDHLGVELVGKTVGVIGLGRIGRAFAERCRGGWGMNVLYTANSPKPDADRDLGARRVELDELLAESDFVSLHCPLTEATAHLIDAPALARMKPTAVLVNTARGEVIDQEALHAALKENVIFAAGLDVTTPEPLPTDSPLLGLSNCVVLPHIGSATRHARGGMAIMAADNVLAGLAGHPLPHPVG
ncbi:2-hydroxyacid dehydrogenase [Alienimonas californiensis]|uniref:Glyoxylate/hydroxypyruvate reductase B n=1 Tax=Alienimonas californiensis TaxID=2527989 RepID=A0A517PD59_9PLAN|nr:D-glycerate dehydrogenase [Alienimonas californiensis]QDT17318.1 Glyoxylate/hydroxypyruvate reductase B [Alienimonas californiensis]